MNGSYLYLYPAYGFLRNLQLHVQCHMDTLCIGLRVDYYVFRKYRRVSAVNGMQGRRRSTAVQHSMTQVVCVILDSPAWCCAVLCCAASTMLFQVGALTPALWLSTSKF